uniref:Uncharacterized protein n=1 Tax=Tanacetum cinerariifolium TaxID=118510 RepID=A0A6L2P1Z0_TANCI|nr:hypothetical protein [Tanacetum cinerariifolium]
MDDEHYDDEAHDDEYVHDDDKKHDDADKEMNDAENADERKDDQEMADADKVDSKKTVEEKVDEEQAGVDQAKDEQTKGVHAKDDQVRLSFLRLRRRSLKNYQYRDKFLIRCPNPARNPFCLSAPILDVLVSMIPLHTTPTPTLTTPLPIPPPTTKSQATVISIPHPSPTVLERLSELEKKVEALSKVDHSKAIEESVQANVINEVKNHLPKFLPKADFVNPRIESIVRKLLQKILAFLAQYSSTPGQSSYKAVESLSEYELKKILFDKMDKSRTYMTHDKHQELYDALLNSIMLDEAITSGDVDPDKVLRKKDHGDD